MAIPTSRPSSYPVDTLSPLAGVADIHDRSPVDPEWANLSQREKEMWGVGTVAVESGGRLRSAVPLYPVADLKEYLYRRWHPAEAAARDRASAASIGWQDDRNPGWIPILMRDPADFGAAISPWIAGNRGVVESNIARKNQQEQLVNNWNLQRLQMAREDAMRAEQRAAQREAMAMNDARWMAEQKSREDYNRAYFKDRQADRAAALSEATARWQRTQDADAAKLDAEQQKLFGEQYAQSVSLPQAQQRVVESMIAKWNANPKNVKFDAMPAQDRQYQLDYFMSEAARQTKAPLQIAGRWDPAARNIVFGPPNPETFTTEGMFGAEQSSWPRVTAGTGTAAGAGMGGMTSAPSTANTVASRPAALTQADLPILNEKLRAALEKAYREGKDVGLLKKRLAVWLRERGVTPPPDWE